jgi:hypothetical protein
MCQRSQHRVMHEQSSNMACQMWARASRSCESRHRRVIHACSNSIYAKRGTVAAYILRRPCSRAERWAPVNSNNPVRKAQNMRLADSPNGP